MPTRAGRASSASTRPTRRRPRARSPRARHLLEAEAHLAAARARHPELATAVLRFAPILGPSAESRLSAYLRPAVVPTALGFDPRIQLIHEDDVIEAVAHALATRF